MVAITLNSIKQFKNIMKIEVSDVSVSEMVNFVSDIANDLCLTQSQAEEFENVLDQYGFNIRVDKSDSDCYQVWEGYV